MVFVLICVIRNYTVWNLRKIWHDANWQSFYLSFPFPFLFCFFLFSLACFILLGDDKSVLVNLLQCRLSEKETEQSVSSPRWFTTWGPNGHLQGGRTKLWTQHWYIITFYIDTVNWSPNSCAFKHPVATKWSTMQVSCYKALQSWGELQIQVIILCRYKPFVTRFTL